VTTLLAIAFILLLLAATIVLGVQQLRLRAVRKQRGIFGEWPIRRVPPESVDPVLKPGPLGPTVETEVAFIGRGPYVVDGGTSDAEAWILAVLARRAKRMFEVGTCTGKTAYLWARNSPPDAHVTTVTLAPDHLSDYRTEASDDPTDVQFALRESSHTEFLYSGTPVASKVEQLVRRQQDARRLAVGGTVRPRCSSTVARLLVRRERQREGAGARRAGGLVLCTTTPGPRHASGVFRALNELRSGFPLVRIEGTTLSPTANR
jgi:hypothetical protein